MVHRVFAGRRNLCFGSYEDLVSRYARGREQYQQTPGQSY